VNLDIVLRYEMLVQIRRKKIRCK